MALTDLERRVIMGVVRRLRSEGERKASPEIEAILADPGMRRWLNTWILPVLEEVASTDLHRMRRRNLLDYLPHLK